MTNTEILYSSLTKATTIDLPENEIVKVDSNCLVCGKKITEGTKYKKILSANFSDYDVMKDLSSIHVCRECGVVIKTRELRTNNFIADKDKIYLLKKNDLENYLFYLEKYITGDFVIGLTRSFKKHNSFRCRVNSNAKNYYIREEDKEYLFNVVEMKELYSLLNQFYLYFTKDEILTGDYKLISIEGFGLQEFNKYEVVFKKYRGRLDFDLLVYMMNSEVRNQIVNERLKKQKEDKISLKN